jgi:hypothetical protein
MGILNLNGFENSILQMSSPVIHTLKKPFSEVFMYPLEHGDGDLGNLSPNIVLKDAHGLGAIHENQGVQVPHRKKS